MNADVFAADETTLVPGRLRVFRCWRLDGSRLTSTGHDFVWRERELTAGCLRHDLDSDHPPAPVTDCSCGVYGWYDPTDCRVVPGPVFGCIEVWGRVVLGSNGVRAEHARIVALASPVTLLSRQTAWQTRSTTRSSGWPIMRSARRVSDWACRCSPPWRS